MKKPPKAVFALIELGTIRGIIIDYRQTGNDTAETFCKILGSGNREASGLWHTYSPYLDVRADWAAIARVKDSFIKEAENWRAFEKINQTELEEYKRLKAKFEGDQS